MPTAMRSSAECVLYLSIGSATDAWMKYSATAPVFFATASCFCLSAFHQICGYTDCGYA